MHDFRRLVPLRTKRTCRTHEFRRLFSGQCVLAGRIIPKASSFNDIRTYVTHDFRRLVPLMTYVLALRMFQKASSFKDNTYLQDAWLQKASSFKNNTYLRYAWLQKASSFKDMCACRTPDFRRLVPLKTILTWGAAGTHVLQCWGADLGTTPPRRAGLCGDQRACELMTCCWLFGWGTACHVIASDTPFLSRLPVAWRDVTSAWVRFKKKKETKK